MQIVVGGHDIQYLCNRFVVSEIAIEAFGAQLAVFYFDFHIECPFQITYNRLSGSSLKRGVSYRYAWNPYRCCGLPGDIAQDNINISCFGCVSHGITFGIYVFHGNPVFLFVDDCLLVGG